MNNIRYEWMRWEFSDLVLLAAIVFALAVIVYIRFHQGG